MIILRFEIDIIIAQSSGTIPHLSTLKKLHNRPVLINSVFNGYEVNCATGIQESSLQRHPSWYFLLGEICSAE